MQKKFFCFFFKFTGFACTSTATVHGKENRRWTREQRQLFSRGLGCRQENRYYRWSAGRSELWSAEDWREHRSKGPLCFMQQMHCGKGAIILIRAVIWYVLHVLPLLLLLSLLLLSLLLLLLLCRWSQHWVRCGTPSTLYAWCVKRSWAAQVFLRGMGVHIVTKTTIISSALVVPIAMEPFGM